MLEKQIEDLNLFRGHLLNHIPVLQELRDCLLFRSKADEQNAECILQLLNYILATIENAENVREVSKVIDLEVLETRFNFIMDNLANTNKQHSDIVDKLIKIEEGEYDE